MINLLLSIFLSAYLVLCLKSYERFKINTFQAIVFNYITCVITGSLYNGYAPAYHTWLQQSWFGYAVYLGSTYFIMINIMGYISQKISATVTSVAGKLSMVIPVVVAYFLYNESLTALKITGVVLALISVILSSLKKEKTTSHLSLKYAIWPLILFVGSGINDSLMKYSQADFLHPQDYASFNIMIFSAAAVAGSIVLIFQLVRGQKFEWKSIPAGVALGIPNFFSLQFLLATLNTPHWDSSKIFPINNIGVVAVTCIAAVIIFREKLTLINLAGLALAFISIAIIFFA